MDTSIKEAFNTPHTNMLLASSRLQRLLLTAVLFEVRFQGKCEVFLNDVMDRLVPLCKTAVPSYSAVLHCAISLAASRLLLCDQGNNRLKAKVALNIPVDDLLYTLNTDKELSWLSDRLK